MNITDQENVTYNNQTFEPESVIRGGRKITFNDCKLLGKFKIHVDRDVEEIVFNRTSYDEIIIGYFKDAGILNGFKMNDCQGTRVNLFYADWEQQLKIDNRRTKNFVLHNVRSYNSPFSPFPLIGIDNPVIENCIGLDAHGDRCNTFQINNCLYPVLRNNVAGRTVTKNMGDGNGIIIDWTHQDDSMHCRDALVENNICFGNRGEHSAGVSNYKGTNSTIRRNILIDNTTALAFNMHSDFDCYDNILTRNLNEVKYYNGADDNGYGSQFEV